MTRRFNMLAVILMASLAVRLLLFVALEPLGAKAFYLGDTVGYMRVADNMLAGHGFTESTSSPYVPSAMRTPVLPFLLAGTTALFGSPIPYVLIQILMSLGVTILAFRIALVTTGSEKLALWAAALSAFEPYSVFINMSLLTETVFSLVYLGGILAAMIYARDRSMWWLSLASAAFALSALIRPIAEFMPLILLALVLYVESPRSWLKAVAYAIIPFLVVLSPWLIRNYEVLGSASISTGGYQNVYSDLGATILSYKNGSDWAAEKSKIDSDFAERHGIKESDLQLDPKLNGVFLREGIAIMAENPVPTVKAAATVFIAFFTNDSWAYYLQTWGWMRPFTFGVAPIQILMHQGPIVAFEKVMAAGGAGLVVPFIGRIFWITVSVLFFIGSLRWIWLGGVQRVYGLLFLAVACYMVVLCFSNGAGINGRYRYPINPILYAPALAAAAGILKRLMLVWRRRSPGT